jgi:hypothetical protein
MDDVLPSGFPSLWAKLQCLHSYQQYKSNVVQLRDTGAMSLVDTRSRKHTELATIPYASVVQCYFPEDPSTNRVTELPASTQTAQLTK